jgi:hypothetical protein
MTAAKLDNDRDDNNEDDHHVVLLTAFRAALPWCLFFQILFGVFLRFGSKISSTTFSRLNTQEQAYWATSMVSSIHSTTVSVYAAVEAYRGGFFSFTSSSSGGDLFFTTWHSTTCLTIFFGYILYDICLVYYFRNDWPGSKAMLIHHIFSLIFSWDFVAHRFAHNLGLSVMLFEATTPFVNCRWFLSKLQQQDSKLYFINGLCMAGGWLATRIVWGAFVGFWIWRMRQQLDEVSLFSKYVSVLGTYVVGYALQWFWFFKIASGGMKMIRKKTNNQPKQSGTSTSSTIKEE